MEAVARIMVVAGIALVAFGGLFWLLARTVGFGRLPGDLSFSGGNVSVYVPLASMLIASLVLTVILNVVLRIFR